ncbi:hypothetical protein [Desulfocurvus sp. DL9XJH121]
MNAREKRIRQLLRDDLIHYAAKCLKIRLKGEAGAVGGIAPLNMNRAQLYLHQRLEEQRAKTGKVRAYVLKGRQQGCSTYIAGRFYHRTTHLKGVSTLILAHRADATDNLFAMVDRFHRNLPAVVKPKTRYSSKKELRFSTLDSGYNVGTAGAGQVGRSQTNHLLHGSEVAFWTNAKEVAAGALQTVPNAPGSEVIFETTAYGPQGFFFEGWQRAEAGDGEYIAVFIPWFWQPEYSAPVPPGFVLKAEEAEYMEQYGLRLGQMVWRRAKIAELGDPLLFCQEYPATAAEAFQNTGADSFIQARDVLLARRASEAVGWGPVVAGVDPARFGDDSTALAVRHGRKVLSLKRHHGLDTMQVAGICRVMLERYEPRIDRMFIDAGGLGAGVVDRLREMGFGERITAVNFGNKATRRERYRNKRSEMWGEMRDWLTDELPADIPDDDALHADLTGPGYSYDSEGRLVLERKEDMRSRGQRSPDAGDALALTFAAPVRSNARRQEYADTGKRVLITQPELGNHQRQAYAD